MSGAVLMMAACSTTSATSATPTTGGSGEANTGGVVRGISDASIRIGTMWADTSEPDSPYVAFTDALAKKINADGGIAGRDVEFAPYLTFDQLNAQDPAQVCAAWEDSPKDFFAIQVGPGSLVSACANASGTLTLVDGNQPVPDADLARPLALSPSGMSVSRVNAALIPVLEQQGGVAGKRIAIYGLLTPQEVTDSGVVAALESAGAAAVDTFVYSRDSGDVQAAALAAILKVKQGNYDLVVTPSNASGETDPLGAAAAFAEQGFSAPIVGPATYAVDIAQYGLKPDSPALKSLVLYGVRNTLYGLPAQQSLDLATASPVGQACVDLAREAGLDLSTDLENALNLCSDVDFLSRSLHGATGKAVTAQTVVEAAQSLPAVDSAPATFGESMTGRRDGAGGVRLLTFDQASGTYEYAADTIEVDK